MVKRPDDLKITAAKHVGGFVLSLKFSDGKINEIDFEPILKSSQHPEVKKYLNQKKFTCFSIKDGELMWGDFDLIFPIVDLYEKSVIS